MSRVEVWRGPAVESVHRFAFAVVDAGGRLRAGSGQTGEVTFARSAVKPIQALPVVQDGAADRFGFEDREIALCCASHSGEPKHVDGVRSMLERIGVEEAALACGPHAPFHGPSAAALAAAGQTPGRIHNNCSGKHAGMLALARFHDWPTAGYNRSDHPVQKRIADELARWAGMPADDFVLATDGCGVVTFGLPLSALARAFSGLAAAARRSDAGPRRVLGAMRGCPDYVAGTDRLCTTLMEVVDGRIIAKTGAEGVYCAAVPGAEIGIAIKVADGARRASEPALLAVLSTLGLLSDQEMARLAAFAQPEVMNTRGEVVGRIRVVVEVDAAGGGAGADQPSG
jgi:L-asparaginase II